jgi:hypothetical protein
MTDNQKAPANVKKAIQDLERVLTEIGWEPEADEEKAGFYVDFGPPHVPVSDAFAAIAVETERFVLYINLGPDVLPERRDEVARFILYANSLITIGNLEMDYEEGYVRFKSSINFANTELSEVLIRNAILSAMNAVDAYADLLIDLVTGRKDAKRAIRDAEAKSK